MGGVKFYEDKGYDKLFISHPGHGDYDFSTLPENAEEIIGKINLAEYDDIVFVAKSIGTVLACQIKENIKCCECCVHFYVKNNVH